MTQPDYNNDVNGTDNLNMNIMEEEQREPLVNLEEIQKKLYMSK